MMLITVMLRRELLLAYRRRAEILQPLVFLLVVVSLFPLGIGPDPGRLAGIAPGVIERANAAMKDGSSRPP